MLVRSLFHALPMNAVGTDFVVGDIHGHVDLLDALLAAVDFDPGVDRLIGLGDLIDRGPDSQVLLERLREDPWFYSVRGNHEAWLQASIDNWGMARSWRQNGGMWADHLSNTVLRDLSAIIDGMPLAMSLDLIDGRKVGLVHAELNEGHGWESLSTLGADTEIDLSDDYGSTVASAALWGRNRITSWAIASTPTELERMVPARLARIRRALMPVEGVDLLIAGHTTLRGGDLASAGNLLWIDTASFYEGGRLTMVDPLNSRYWQSRYENGLSGPVVVNDGGKLPPPLELPLAILNA